MLQQALYWLQHVLYILFFRSLEKHMRKEKSYSQRKLWCSVGLQIHWTVQMKLRSFTPIPGIFRITLLINLYWETVSKAYHECDFYGTWVCSLTKRVIHPNNKRAKTLQRKTSGKRSEKEGFWGGSSNESVDSSVSSKVSRQERKDKVQLIQMLM